MEDKLEPIKKIKYSNQLINPPLSYVGQLALTPKEENLINQFANLMVDRLFEDLDKENRGGNKK